MHVLKLLLFFLIREDLPGHLGGWLVCLSTQNLQDYLHSDTAEQRQLWLPFLFDFFGSFLGGRGSVGCERHTWQRFLFVLGKN